MLTLFFWLLFIFLEFDADLSRADGEQLKSDKKDNVSKSACTLHQYISSPLMLFCNQHSCIIAIWKAGHFFYLPFLCLKVLSAANITKKIKLKFTKAWLSFLRLPLPLDVYKEVSH